MHAIQQFKPQNCILLNKATTCLMCRKIEMELRISLKIISPFNIAISPRNIYEKNIQPILHWVLTPSTYSCTVPPLSPPSHQPPIRRNFVCGRKIGMAYPYNLVWCGVTNGLPSSHKTTAATKTTTATTTTSIWWQNSATQWIARTQDLSFH